MNAGYASLLKLKKVELLGFKSFCDREELRFTGNGIASIVGPNGCGKSNISDAISWVLGEQSAKSLRGQRMDDVIFNGSRSRKPSGLSTVTLTLLDPDSYLEEIAQNRPMGAPIPQGKRSGEITVSRKLFRSGESRYIINGKTVRLRDVHDLFMGTGLGPNHYAIIEQGRIGQILSSRPLDRRAFIEEAAGVTKFKSRKRLAELKLENAKQNLHRVNDILQEIVRQANSLKRQAAKAERFEEYRGLLGEALSRLLASRFRRMDADRRRLATDVEAAEKAFEERYAKAEAMEQELADKRGNEQRWEAELDKCREELSRLTVDAERLKARIDQQARTATENTARKEQAEIDIAGIVTRLASLTAELGEGEQAVGVAATASSELNQRLQAKNAEIASEQQGLQALQAEEESGRAKTLTLLNEVAGARSRVGKLEEFMAGNDRLAEQARQQETGAGEELQQYAERHKQLIERVDAEQTRIEQTTRERNEIQAAIATLKQQHKQHLADSNLLRGDVSRLTARRESLSEILSHRAYTTESVKGIFEAVERQPVDGFKPIGILADYIEVDADYERAAKGFLREELEYVVVSDWSEAAAGVQLMRSDLEGHATFLVHPESPIPAETPALGPETGVLGRLSDHVRLTNGLAASASTLLPKLRCCYLVEDAQVARGLAVRYPDRYFLMPDGTCYRGYTLSAGTKASAGPLVLKRELRELVPKIVEVEQRFDRASRAAAQAEQEITSKTERLETVRAELQTLEKTALAGEHELRQTKEQIQRVEKTRTATVHEIERLSSETARVRAQHEEQTAAIEQRDKERLELDARVAELVEQTRQRRERLAALNEQQAGLRTEVAALEERRRAALAVLARARQAVDEQRQRKTQVGQHISLWDEESARLLTDNEKLTGQVDSGTARRTELQRVVGETSRNLEASRGRTVALVGEVKEQREAVELLRRERSNKELELVQVRSDLKHLSETCQAELNKPVDEVAKLAPEDLTPDDLREAEEQYHELKEKIERLGAVNVLALEEYEEVRQRQTFLETHHQDLLQSIEDTQATIKEIDFASREKFDEAFRGVNENFGKKFSILFGGGVGEMRLTDAENLDESGIDIVAQPPGKRLQNIALLSGGEKSLAALALLMATFEYKPSPFCVLDEVDAPLDEANNIRFRRLLQEMSDQTQFIIITHSKTTMEVAESLYGVTMSEPGVSKLVSVRMADGLRESQPAPEPEREENAVSVAG